LKDKIITKLLVGKKINSKIFGMPSGINDLDKAIDELLYIANSRNLIRLNLVKLMMKIKTLSVFWWKRNQTKQ